MHPRNGGAEYSQLNARVAMANMGVQGRAANTPNSALADTRTPAQTFAARRSASALILPLYAVLIVYCLPQTWALSEPGKPLALEDPSTSELPEYLRGTIDDPEVWRRLEARESERFACFDCDGSL